MWYGIEISTLTNRKGSSETDIWEQLTYGRRNIEIWKEKRKHYINCSWDTWLSMQKNK